MASSSSASASGATFFIPFFSLILFMIAGLCYGGCIESERAALLQFKNGLSGSSTRLSDWVSNGSSDCCRWSGVVCHNITSHVLELHLRTLSSEEYFDDYLSELYDYSEYEEYYNKSALGGKVSASLLELKHLNYLDLSYNDFGGVAIPKFIGSLKSLTYLNLSMAGFRGMIPPQIGNLSNLSYLNLHSSYMYYLDVENLDWVSSLSSLEFLDMSGVDLSQSFDWLKVINSLPSLLQLYLSSCHLPPVFNHPTYLPSLNSSSLVVLDLSINYFEGPIPNMTSSFLRELDLSDNNFNSSIPNWLYDLTHLQLLNLRFNQLQGQISSASIGNLTSLITLDLSENLELEFEKGISNSFRNFCSLRKLDLSSIKLNQEINHVLAIMSSGCVSDVLQSLALHGCQLSGHLTDDLSYFKNLIDFDIGSNSISGPIPTSLGELNSLKYLYLDFNRLNGSLPVSFGNLKQLKDVYINDNKLEGEVSDLHFVNLTMLYYFHASGNNNIALRVSSNWIPPLQLRYLSLESWRIGPQFPEWLRLLEHLTYLDLSNSEISTSVPIWFWDSFPQYGYLNLSHNQMHGSISNIPFSNGDLPSIIDLNSNSFSGAVPHFSSNVNALDLSNNSFSGSIFHFLCYKMNEVKQMQVLNLERNLLHGEIPDCWSSWKHLAAIKLSNNKFGGNIPNSIGNLSILQFLNLRNNNLSGEIPSQIQNCMNLLTLDLGENYLVGNVPTWIGDRFADLSILRLRANKFDGYLPKELCGLVSLHILDLAHNSFSGTIPSCFKNFTEMAIRNDSTGPVYYSYYYYGNTSPFTESSLIVMKGKVMEYNTILGLVRSLDLSDNNLSGEIPKELTILAGLLSLNLSRNALTGKIPNDIGNMRELEAIDFSQNQLSGEIPPSMSALTFLSTLNLSHNNLFGKIPLGTQLQGFDPSSFMDNQLCGLPLTVNCSGDGNQPENEKHHEDVPNEDETDWFYLSMAYGFGVGFWTAMCSLIFIKRWRHFYFGFLHNLWEKIWWSCCCRFF